MLTHPTLNKLEHLRFTGMARALRLQLDDPEMEHDVHGTAWPARRPRDE